ncbi:MULTISPECIES: lipocalin-like domain-containing protein [Gammaproteobacteria]|uniref:lipocalin-like domain-containing protein n=1 Tax=Gammaproteobacteria TaxID=1236 RepID=UPI00155929BA|nr:lipocalin-like domain-containing protein [Xanthomonas arboricola]
MADKNGRLLDDQASFDRLGIDRDHPQTWEDALRLKQPFKPGEWEWWYADAHFSDGLYCVVSFHIQVDAEGRNTPFINLNIARDGTKLADITTPFDDGRFEVSDTQCDVRIGKSFFRGLDGLERYHIHVDPDENQGHGLDLVLERTVRPYRPGTGRWENADGHFSWFSAVPGARTKGSLFVAGKAIEVEGNGYHDHNWGDVPMDHLLSDWLWGRAEVEGVTVVASSVRFRTEAGGLETPLLYVARGEQVHADVINDQLICLEGVKVPVPQTGKKVSSDCVYIVDLDGLKGNVRFDGQRTIVASFPFTNSSPDWETWHAKFVAKVSVDLATDEEHLQVSGVGSLENMDFLGRRRQLQ